MALCCYLSSWHMKYLLWLVSHAEHSRSQRRWIPWFEGASSTTASSIIRLSSLPQTKQRPPVPAGLQTDSCARPGPLWEGIQTVHFYIRLNTTNTASFNAICVCSQITLTLLWNHHFFVFTLLNFSSRIIKKGVILTMDQLGMWCVKNR